jgi:S1/P1 Nuclease
LFARPAGAWFAEGHQTAAIIAANDLTPTSRSRVAQILGVSADTGSVEKAMAAASIRPDTEFHEEDRTTAQWHYIDICPPGQGNRFTGAVPTKELRQQRSMNTRVAFTTITMTNGAPAATWRF